MKSLKLFLEFILFLLFVACSKEPASLPGQGQPLPITQQQTGQTINPVSINTNLIANDFDTLSQARYYVTTAAAGSKLFFAGGMYIVPACWLDTSDNTLYDCRLNSNRVDIYDTITRSWTRKDLPRSYASGKAVTVGHKIFLTGGVDTAINEFSTKIDVYDADQNSWSTIQFGTQRYGFVTISAGNKIFIAGGKEITPSGHILTDKVEIYDVSTGTWSLTNLSRPRGGMGVAIIGNKVIFAGGDANSWSPVFSTIDIYDLNSQSWTNSQLSEAKSNPVAFVIGDNAYFAGGRFGMQGISKKMEIYNSINQTWTVKDLPFFASPTTSTMINNRAVLFYGRNVQIYDAPPDKWFAGTIDREINYPGILSLGNSVYLAGGGSAPGVSYQTNAIYRIYF